MRTLSEEQPARLIGGSPDTGDRYWRLFEDLPFPLWRADFSEVRKYLHRLRAPGVQDPPDRGGPQIPEALEKVGQW